MDSKGPPLKEIVAQETDQLSEQHKRLSVRDLASKFDKNLSAGAKLSNEAKPREVASLEGHVLLKKLRDALEYLRGRLAGKKKEDAEKAIFVVEALAVKLTQNEGELIQEKFEVKKLANFLKQASEDAKKLVNQERSFTSVEIESAKAVVRRIGEALVEQERVSLSLGKQEIEEMVEEIQQTRRIRLTRLEPKLQPSPLLSLILVQEHHHHPLFSLTSVAISRGAHIFLHFSDRCQVRGPPPSLPSDYLLLRCLNRFVESPLLSFRSCMFRVLFLVFWRPHGGRRW
ncbi:hypothetical protein LXL04_007947 [Taraxacum kok-saghyz]